MYVAGDPQSILVTEVPFLRGFSLEHKEKYQNNTVSTGTALLQKESNQRPA